MRKRTWKPRFGSNVPCTTPNITPPRPASPPARSQTYAPLRSTSIPEIAASSRLPEPRRGEEEGDRRRHDRGDHERDRLAGRDPHETEVVHRRLIDPVRSDRRASADEDDVPQHERETGRDERERDQAPSP